MAAVAGVWVAAEADLAMWHKLYYYPHYWAVDVVAEAAAVGVVVVTVAVVLADSVAEVAAEAAQAEAGKINVTIGNDYNA